VGAHSYIYRAVDAAGAAHSGAVVSASRSAALEDLSRRGLVPVELREAPAANSPIADSTESVRAPSRFRLPARLRWTGRRQANQRELLTLTQSLAALLNAGLTIDRAMQISAALTPKSVSRTLTEKLLHTVRAGKTLSEAVEASGQRVPSYYVSMVNAGEVGGSLASTLTRLAELMRRQVEVREKIRSALVYPALLAAVVLFTLVMLLTFVLPRFETLFAESDAPLPFSTRLVLGMGRFVADYWWAAAGLIAAAVVAFVAWVRSPTGRAQFDAWILKSRLTLGLPAATNTARLLRTLSTLCTNGLPLPTALRVARGTLGNQRLLEALGRVTNEVQSGEPFSASLARAAVFPPVAAQLARVGEETGKLDQMLLSAAIVLEDESQLRLERLLSLFIPLLTVGMGLIVAALIGSVLIGLLSINDLAF
jgi:general secretion pathway protein F